MRAGGLHRISLLEPSPSIPPASSVWRRRHGLSPRAVTHSGKSGGDSTPVSSRRSTQAPRLRFVVGCGKAQTPCQPCQLNRPFDVRPVHAGTMRPGRAPVSLKPPQNVRRTALARQEFPVC
jgi:hypothetical protein